jgi:hypothetical protein
MFTKFCLISGVVAAVTLAGTPASAAVVSRTAFQEERAVLAFTHVEPLVCDDGSSSSLITDVFVITTERREGGALTSEARAEVVRRNGCTGEFQEAFPVVTDPDAEVSGVDAARLDVSFELIEFSTGEPLGFLDVALDFDGSGDVTRRFETTTRCSDGLTTRTRSRLESNIADVEGTVALNGVDLLGGVEFFAELATSDVSEVVLQRSECACSGGASDDPELGDDGADDEVAAAEALSAATVTTTAFDSEAANASFRNVEPIVCGDGTNGTLETSVVLGVSAEVTRFNAETSESSQANASVFRFDSCTGEFLISFAFVPEPEYEQQGTVSATLDESFELADSTTGEPAGVLETALVFTGTGAAACESSFSIMDTPPGVFSEGRLLTIDRSTRESRSASLSGSAALDGLELVNDVQFADLVTTSQRTLRIER